MARGTVLRPPRKAALMPTRCRTTGRADTDPRAVDQRRTQLRRRLRVADGGHPAQHRGDRARRPPRAAAGRGALAADRLRVRPRRRRRRLPRVVLQGRPRRARAVRAGGRGVDPQRAAARRGLLVRVRQRPGDRPADHDQRVARPARAEGHRHRGRRHLRHLRRHPRHGRQPDRRHGRARLPRLGLEVQGRHPDRLRPRVPRPAGQHVRDADLPALHGDRPGADDPAGRRPAPHLAVRADRARGLRPRRLLRAGRLRHRVRHARSASSSSAAGGRS